MLVHSGKSFDDMAIRPYEFARRAWRNVKNNECEIVIVYGMPEGVGKSNYVSHGMADVAGYYRCQDWEKLKWMKKSSAERPKDTPIWDTDYESIKPLIMYPPEDVVSFLMNMLLRKEKVPMWHWDDGGTWLNSMEWTDPFVVSFMEFLPLARSVCGLVVISTPVEEWVLKKLHTATGVIHAPIIKLSANDDHIWRPRSCRAFKKVKANVRMRNLIHYQWDDTFSAMLSDDFYGWYKPRRDHYTKLAVAKMHTALEKKKLKGIKIRIDESVLEQIREGVADANDTSVDFRELVSQIGQEQH